MTELVSCQYLSAGPMPLPGAISTPASIMAISAPQMALAIMISSLFPRCPMRNTLPATFERPTPMDRLYFAYAFLTMRALSIPCRPQHYEHAECALLPVQGTHTDALTQAAQMSISSSMVNPGHLTDGHICRQVVMKAGALPRDRSDV